MSTTQQKRYTLSNNFTHCGKGGEGSLNIIHCQCKKKTVKYCKRCQAQKQNIGQKHNKNKCNRIIVAELLYNQRFKEPPPNNNWELMDPINWMWKNRFGPHPLWWLYPLERWKVPYWQLGSIHHEKKFNVKVSFDENLYTTKLDFKSIDYERRLGGWTCRYGEIEGWGVQNVLLRDDARWRPFSSLNNPPTSQQEECLICFLCLHTISEDEGIAF